MSEDKYLKIKTKKIIFNRKDAPPDTYDWSEEGKLKIHYGKENEDYIFNDFKFDKTHNSLLAATTPIMYKIEEEKTNE